MIQETGVQSQVESYQRLKKWYLMLPCLTLSILRYRSRVKLSNPGKGVAPSPTPRCISYRKGNLRVTLDYGRQLYLLTTSLYSKFSLSKTGCLTKTKEPSLSFKIPIAKRRTDGFMPFSKVQEKSEMHAALSRI